MMRGSLLDTDEAKKADPCVVGGMETSSVQEMPFASLKGDTTYTELPLFIIIHHHRLAMMRRGRQTKPHDLSTYFPWIFSTILVTSVNILSPSSSPQTSLAMVFAS